MHHHCSWRTLDPMTSGSRVGDQRSVAALAGAILVVANVRRVERTTARSGRVSLVREFGRIRHYWLRQLSHAVAAVGGTLGVVLLLHAFRGTQQPERSEIDASTHHTRLPLPIVASRDSRQLPRSLRRRVGDRSLRPATDQAPRQAGARRPKNSEVPIPLGRQRGSASMAAGA
jgi:hypothetical protein